MTGRNCGACKHFEQAPIWRKGWCRNPLLYSPQQSHLVSAEVLDCERGMGNYWEPADDTAADAELHHPLTLHSRTPKPSSRNRMRSASGTPVYPVSGSSGAYGGDPPPPQGGPGGGGRWGGGGDDRGEFGYYEEERYWTDYLRIAMPILGVLLMVALFWFWVSTFLGDDNGDDDAANGDNGLPTTEATATDEDQAGADETQEDPVELPTATDAPDEPGEPTDEQEAPEEPEGENGEPEEPEDPGGGEIYPGATAEVGNTGGAGVNVRAEPSTEAEVLDIFADGIQVTTTDDAIEAEGFIWWPITGEGIELGWIVDDYLILIE